jgi:hypothetical protein
MEKTEKKLNSIIFQNEFFTFYLSDESNIHLDSKSKDEQKKYELDEIMSQDDKLKRIDNILEYFYNFWKLLENTGDERLYTMHFNINLVMINVPPPYFIKIKNTLDSLKSVFTKNLKESYFKIEHKLSRYFFDLVLKLYVPIKPIHIIE